MSSGWNEKGYFLFTYLFYFVFCLFSYYQIKCVKTQDDAGPKKSTGVRKAINTQEFRDAACPEI